MFRALLKLPAVDQTSIKGFHFSNVKIEKLLTLINLITELLDIYGTIRGYLLPGYCIIFYIFLITAVSDLISNFLFTAILENLVNFRRIVFFFFLITFLFTFLHVLRWRRSSNKQLNLKCIRNKYQSSPNWRWNFNSKSSRSKGMLYYVLKEENIAYYLKWKYTSLWRRWNRYLRPLE